MPRPPLLHSLHYKSNSRKRKPNRPRARKPVDQHRKANRKTGEEEGGVEERHEEYYPRMDANGRE